MIYFFYFWAFKPDGNLIELKQTIPFNYEIRVRAGNDVGFGDFGPIFFYKKPSRILPDLNDESTLKNNRDTTTPTETGNFKSYSNK